MKKLLFTALALAGMIAEAKFVDPNPYGDYGPAMRATPGKPMAIEWHYTDRAAIDKATSEDAIEAILADEASVEALLAKVKPAYATDALDFARIAAVTRYVMEGETFSWWQFWLDDRSDERKLWAKALLKKAFSAKDEYVVLFCLDQLRWCGLCCQAGCVKELAAKSESKAVKEMADILVDQITGNNIK